METYDNFMTTDIIPRHVKGEPGSYIKAHDAPGDFWVMPARGGKFRAYYIELVQSYSLSFGHGGWCGHERKQALRHQDGSFIAELTESATWHALRVAIDDGDIIPYGFNL